MVKVVCSEELKGKTLVTGFLGLGHVGFLCIDHIIKTLNTRKVGYIDTVYVPPFVNVANEKLITPYELYVYGDAIFLRFESIPSGKSGSILMRRMVQWAKRERVKRLILIGGLNESFREEGEESQVRYICNTKWEKQYGIRSPIVQHGVQVVGPLALLLNYSEIYEIPAISLLAYANPSRVDPRAAAYAIEAMGQLLDLKIEVGSLLESAVVIEEEMEKALHKINRRGELYGDSSMYA